MPTFREDLHLGHKVATVETDDLINKCVTEEKLDDHSFSLRTLAQDVINYINSLISDAIAALRSEHNEDVERLDNRIDNLAATPVTTSKIANNAVTTPKIANKAVTPEKVSDNFIGTIVAPLVNAIDNKYRTITNELYSMIRSLQVGGLALSDRLGSREDIGITQKAITDVINALNARIDDIAGEWTQGFSMIVTPDNFISEDTCQVNISASAQTGVFDHIAFYADDELLAEGDQIATFAYLATINDTCTIKCVASILGREYIKTKVVTKYYPFFIGGGNTIDDVLIPENAREHTGSIVGSYDVVISEGQKIWILVPVSLTSQFIRFDMNGYEIPVSVTQDGNNMIYESLNTYQAGTYNIDITDNRS